jgi:hypothetical protein
MNNMDFRMHDATIEIIVPIFSFQLQMAVKSKTLQQKTGLTVRSTNLQQHQQEAQLKMIAVQRKTVAQPVKETHYRCNSV